MVDKLNEVTTLQSKNLIDKFEKAMGVTHEQVARKQAADTPTKPEIPINFEDSFQKRLDLAGFTQAELTKVAMSIVESGCYTETYKLFNKLPVVFTSRLQEDQTRLMNELEMRNSRWAVTQDFTRLNFNLASSLLQYGPHKLDHTPNNEDSFIKRFEFVQRLPAPIISVLHSKLMQFDQKVSLAMELEFLENF
jgi:hypothetical protein